ncbi:DUF1810 domain-containing protein [Nitratireductor kimnyeongensis]|nr:DUF1810 domain-containing protein [Nitratireductor kimnyeongensis]QZZ37449.1 DUF1810 domain-containing protein [Nitratireductor kimnyeongensis]
MRDPFNLQRFTEAQEGVFETALRELRSGRKQTHWMWFVFPQLRGLGRSRNATYYGISSLEEARAYLKHPVLGPRLQEATTVVLKASGQSLAAILGRPDDQKFRSCMTLFALVSRKGEDLFSSALARWCGGTMDDATLRLAGLTVREQEADRQ